MAVDTLSTPAGADSDTACSAVLTAPGVSDTESTESHLRRRGGGGAVAVLADTAVRVPR